MELDEFCTRMRQEVRGYSHANREETAAFLIWFLVNYFRIEVQDAIDSVCDHTNDKGIDGICIDEEEETVYLFQSKYSPIDEQDQGDNDLRNFVGARQWFQNEHTVRNLLESTAHHDLKSLVTRTNIAEKTHYALVSVFVTNKRFNTHAHEYADVTESLETYDLGALFREYTYFADADIATPPVDLRLSNQTSISYSLPGGTIVRVYAVRAKELLKLDGIQDRTLFYKNVRYGVGNTRVNKSLRTTILKTDEHAKFFLYHNGITIVCGNLEDISEHCIRISNYAVVNGCQSMLSFYENRDHLSNNLYVLTKIIKLNIADPMVGDITYYNNNQNSISMADLRSNDSVQKALKREFQELFGDRVCYRRKRGEAVTENSEVIEKDFAAQLIEAVYYGSPHNTHLKQKLFGEEYPKIFSRRVDAAKIYLAYLFYRTVEENSSLLDKVQIRTYGLATFFFSHALCEIMKKDALGSQIVESPRAYVTAHRTALERTLKKLWQLITPDINADIEDYAAEQDGFFDYKNVFKNSAFVDHMTRRVIADYERLTRRNVDDSFGHIFASFAAGQ